MNCTSRYLIPDWPVPPHILCFSSTRQQGCSQSPFGSFNLAMHVGDQSRDVSRNRQQLQQDWRLPSQLNWLNQIHGSTCLNLDHAADHLTADASKTTKPFTVCTIMTADCLPILICNKKGTEIAAIHAGWRSLAAGIIDATISQCRSKPSELMAWLGPAIGAGKFEINSDIKQLFINKNSGFQPAFIGCDQRIRASLDDLARINLESLGIQHIYGGGYCTFEDQKRFFSYRRDQQTGRMASLICITQSQTLIQ